MSHWYLNGKAWHFQPDGKPTNLRHARKHLKETGEAPLPSVTTIIGLLDAPALTKWKLKQVTSACYSDELMRKRKFDEYHRAMLDQALGPDVTGVDRGSLIHDAIEDFLLGKNAGGFQEDIREIAYKAVEQITDYCQRAKFEVEQIVTGNLDDPIPRYAGKVDAYNDEFVIDWKTKDIGNKTVSQLAFPNHAMQLAAYSACLKGPGFLGPKGRRCLNVFIDRQEAGKVVIKEWSREEIETAWRKFELLLKYWQLDKGYPE